jgi:hypothetical protein
VHDIDDLQTTLTLGPVNRAGQALSLEFGLQLTLSLPNQDEPLPEQIERPRGPGRRGPGATDLARFARGRRRDGSAQRGPAGRRFRGGPGRGGAGSGGGAATGFPGGEPAFPGALDQTPEVEPGFVIVVPDAVKTKAQPTTGHKEVGTSTAVVLVAGGRSAFAEATAERLWFQGAALLLELGVLRGERPWLALGDGAAGIGTWFEGLGISPKAMIVCWWPRRNVCWWPRRNRCSEPIVSLEAPRNIAALWRRSCWGSYSKGRWTLRWNCCRERGSG